MGHGDWGDMPRQQQKRTLYLLTYLETGSKKRAEAVAGYGSKNTLKRLCKMLRDRGNLAEAEHVREPVKFTDDVFHEAKDYLVDNHARPISTTEVIAYLEHRRLLHSPTNTHNFLGHFAAWVAEQGWTLSVSCRGMIFQITEERAYQRLEWVRAIRPQLGRDFQLGDIIIVDETTFEEGPHPKGKPPKLTRPCFLWPYQP